MAQIEIANHPSGVGGKGASLDTMGESEQLRSQRKSGWKGSSVHTGLGHRAGEVGYPRCRRR